MGFILDNNTFLLSIFVICLLLLIHTYVLYPLIIKGLARGKSLNDLVYKSDADLPIICVLMAAYNEESVIRHKIESLLAQDYPQDKLHIYVGSDNSSDATNLIMEDYAKQYGHIYFHLFSSRTGKPGIINDLAQFALSKNDGLQELVFLMTDASVMLDPKATRELAKHFRHPDMGLVDAHMIYTGIEDEGISQSESTYLNSEVTLKQNESKLWGHMIGPFGGCFAMRSDLFKPVPRNFLVDDFYLAMKVLEQNKMVINDLSAKAYEQVSHASSEEYRRKKRISTGNFQNLYQFKGLLNPFTSLGFAFISHKVIRWMGPFLMLAIGLSSMGLAVGGSQVFGLLVLGQALWYVAVPLLDVLLKKVNVHLSLLRNISYFNRMNLALGVGFVDFLRGVKSNIWEPTKRV